MSSLVKSGPSLRMGHGYLFCLAIFILSFAVCANGQAPGSTRGLSSGDGTHTIQGRVFFPSGQSLTGFAVKVNLEGANTSGGVSTTTDQDGAFRFNSVRAGTYSVVVIGGKDFETAREPVNIDPGGTSGPVTNLTIHLRPRLDASNPAFAGVPQNALDFYQKGTAAAQKNNLKTAADLLSKAVAAYPNFSVALSDLGVIYLKLNQSDKAVETFEALVKLKPNDAAAHLNLGIAFYNQSTELVAEKKLDESAQKAGLAENQLREALKLNSPGFMPHYYLGMSLIKLRKFDEAQKELELTISNGGENLAQAHRFLGGLYQRAQKNKEAADELEKYLKLEPKAVDADHIKEIIKGLRK